MTQVWKRFAFDAVNGLTPAIEGQQTVLLRNFQEVDNYYGNNAGYGSDSDEEKHPEDEAGGAGAGGD